MVIGLHGAHMGYAASHVMEEQGKGTAHATILNQKMVEIIALDEVLIPSLAMQHLALV